MVGAMAMLGDERQQRQARDWVRRGFLAARRELGAGAGSTGMYIAGRPKLLKNFVYLLLRATSS